MRGNLHLIAHADLDDGFFYRGDRDGNRSGRFFSEYLCPTDPSQAATAEATELSGRFGDAAAAILMFQSPAPSGIGPQPETLSILPSAPEYWW
ncbi:MAG: hypothetical protein ABL957_00640 [Parvularculaceae bacterium]